MESGISLRVLILKWIRRSLVLMMDSKMDDDDLDNILKRDIWWDSKKCLDSGLIDEIYENKKI